MKWLAVLLALTNVGFFGWHFLLPAPFGDKPPPLSFDAASSLDRLGEVDLDDFIRRVPLRGRELQAVCFAVGPLTGDYSEGAVTGRVREWLESQGGRVDLRTDRFHEVGYTWVYLPPAGTLDAARERAKELTAKAFGNAVVIPEGNMKNAVSIGVYGLRTALERDLIRLKAKGFEPEWQRVWRTGRSSWFTAQFPPDYEFPVKRFAVAFEGLEAVDTRCPPPSEPSADASEAVIRPFPDLRGGIRQSPVVATA